MLNLQVNFTPNWCISVDLLLTGYIYLICLINLVFFCSLGAAITSNSNNSNSHSSIDSGTIRHSKKIFLNAYVSGIVISTKDTKSYKPWLLDQKSIESERQILLECLNFSCPDSIYLTISPLFVMVSITAFTNIYFLSPF